jgi:hypothetical protein
MFYWKVYANDIKTATYYNSEYSSYTMKLGKSCKEFTPVLISNINIIIKYAYGIRSLVTQLRVLPIS